MWGIHNPDINDAIRKKQEELLKKIDYIESQKSFDIGGRGILWSENLKAAGDTIDESKAVRESINNLLIDFHIKKQLFPNIRIFGELRFKNDLSGFYGLGDSFEAREIYIESILLDFIKIRIGDFYQELTPLTFYVPHTDVIYKKNVFNIIEEKKKYDEFALVDGFPLQGVNFSGKCDTTFYLNKFDFYGSIARYQESEYNRFISSGQITLARNDILSVKYTIVNYYDIKETKITNAVKPAVSDTINSFSFNFYPIEVITGKKQIKDAPGINLFGEFANSSFIADLNKNDIENDYAVNIGLSGWVYMNKIDITYREAGNEFYSPAAQSQPFFTKKLNANVLSYLSSQNLNFHFSDKAYNNKIYFYRNWYNPEKLIFPMNNATPNRKGFSIKYKNNYLRFVSVSFGYDTYNEIRAMRSANKRYFTGVNGGINFDLRKIDNFLPTITVDWKKEKIKRDDDVKTTSINESEDVYNQKLTLSGNFLLDKNWEVMGGISLFKVSGYRWIDFNNTINPLDENINSYYESYNLEQSYILGGIKYNINSNSFIMVYYKFISSKDKYQLNFVDIYTSVLF